MKENKVSTESYKGVRDFYPQDMFIQKHIFNVMRKTAESYGYAEYGASILEPTELYKSKTSDEIVNEQTYSFIDRGDREVTLRPEMTPTVARMVAARKRDLAFPLRWYSIPNLFRYEKPQRGRLREHFQLNVDIFGVNEIAAETEVISFANDLMKNLGATASDFEIKINSRKIQRFVLGSIFSLTDEAATNMIRLIDKKEKMTPFEFKAKVQDVLAERADDFISLLEVRNIDEYSATLQEKFSANADGLAEIKELFSMLDERGVTSAVFDPTLSRGFDYYTGIVFEVFDTNPENKRALFGGGRYDDLLSVFGSEKVPAVGFGMGDVTIQDFLETRNLLPAYRSSAQLYLCRVKGTKDCELFDLAEMLRKEGVNVAVELLDKNIGDQIKTASRLAIPYISVVGEDEIKSGTFKIKNLESGEERSVSKSELAGALLADKE